MAVAAGELSQLWSEWGIHILVLLSFALQVLLLALGGMRRRGLSAWQRVAVWLAYLLADSTAIYALGHLSITTSASGEHRLLVAFWAPFLLLHLGGPDNITAYALEDNRLWLRHLQTLAVQVLGVAYVIYKYMVGSGSLLLRASVAMFVAGVAKYGERTWALRRANVSSSGSKSGEEEADPRQFLRESMGEEEVLLRAHSQLALCRSGFEDTSVIERNIPANAAALRCYHLKPYYEEEIFKLLEMEMSLMYDILYTKAAVIHTWYGLCIHLTSLIATSTAFVLFQLELISSRASISNSSRSYSMADVAVSYVLMVGALVLEAISACRAVLSSWTCYYILCKAEDYSGRAPGIWLEWLHRYVLSPLRKPFRPASRRRWRGTIGQYNLLHLCTQDKTDLGSRLATKIGCKDWWNKLHFSGTFSGSDDSSLSMQRFQELLFKVLRQEGFAAHRYTSTMDTRGRYSLDRKGAFKGVAEWSVLNTQFDESIIIWHIATDVFISETGNNNNNDGHELVEATRVLSNYMMYLLVSKPNMLPGRARRNVYLRACKILESYASGDECKSVIRPSSPTSWSKCGSILEQLFHHEGPNTGSNVTFYSQREKHVIKKLLLQWSPNLLSEQGRVNLGGSIDSLQLCALYLAKELLSLDGCDTLQLIFTVWVEMMLYAAEYCSRDSHARELSNGGEFMTIVWLLVQHWMYAFRHKIAC